MAKQVLGALAIASLLSGQWGCESPKERGHRPAPPPPPSSSATASSAKPDANPSTPSAGNGDGCLPGVALDACTPPSQCFARSLEDQQGVCARPVSFADVHGDPAAFSGSLLAISGARAVPKGMVCPGFRGTCHGDLVLSDVRGYKAPLRYLRLFNQREVQYTCMMRHGEGERCTVLPHKHYLVIARLREKPPRSLTVEAMLPEAGEARRR